MLSGSNTNCFNIDYQYECYAKDTGEHLKLMKRQIYEIQNFDENVGVLKDEENTETFKHTNSILQNHQACLGATPITSAEDMGYIRT